MEGIVDLSVAKAPPPRPDEGPEEWSRAPAAPEHPDSGRWEHHARLRVETSVWWETGGERHRKQLEVSLGLCSALYIFSGVFLVWEWVEVIFSRCWEMLGVFVFLFCFVCVTSIYCKRGMINQYRVYNVYNVARFDS